MQPADPLEAVAHPDPYPYYAALAREPRDRRYCKTASRRQHATRRPAGGRRAPRPLPLL
ncbi:cytochrome, partial [Bordetella pertussis]